ncbi:UDP-N-acetylmuramate dehydrogenase [Algoriphagus sp. AK58]|uniref:UDP-N-acetylmuramate dehydrogenase n=1 Tax=Algoriphagus sp. AK58 TaxID=1406877 RepID=UPI0016503974|nr:UDP-N-acetylmuramate dehydrogenase [Algoriphagus sp. AK58]MBC6369210.1 UDP-N-acetylenolpyruvoylglucosamine reductase [Algoriphagus sp. AK58]
MNVQYNFELTEYNGYRIKSFCKIAYFPENEEDILDIISKEDNLTIIGSGHNIILSKEYYEQPFLIINNVINEARVNYNVIEAGAGAYLHEISELALRNSLSGLEFCYDIPSSVGGAVVMNAGTKEGVISDVLQKVRFLDLKNLQFKELEKDQVNLNYRSSIFQDNSDAIILKAWFLLSLGEPIVIRKKMHESKCRRWSIQPREYPNCGSVFKRPPGVFVGPMIDELGLKGFSIGGAQVSEKHSGFIVNRGNASGEDILRLIAEIKYQVKDNFGIDLEVEQRII